MISGNGATFFEELGLYYIGPVDGHNIEDLVHILEKVKATPAPGPVLIHVVTEKGKGYTPAEIAADKMHGEFVGRVVFNTFRVPNSFRMWRIQGYNHFLKETPQGIYKQGDLQAFLALRLSLNPDFLNLNRCC